MFLVIDDQDPGQQFQFVAEHLHGQRAREKGRIHENASSERKIVGDRFRVAEGQMGGRIFPEGSVCENDLDVGDPESGLVDDEQRGGGK